jgi:two-component system response regulator BaeR
LTKRRILIVDDDARSCLLLAEFLQGLGYATSVVCNGLQVAPEVRRFEPALVLLDVNLPGLDGIEVCHQLRRFSAVPIIMLSGRVEEIDRTLGLEMGADDYVCKPYSPRELSARIKAQLRRADGRIGAPAGQHGFRVDHAGQRIECDGEWLPLTSQEFRILCKLVARPGQLFSREDLLPGDADADARAAGARAVDTHVKNLRRKIAAVRPAGAGITSVYGLGYRFDPVEEVAEEATGALAGSATA